MKQLAVRITVLVAVFCAFTVNGLADEPDGIELKDAFDDLVNNMPRGVESRESCLKAARNGSPTRFVGYFLSQNEAYDDRYEVVGVIQASKLLRETTDQFQTLSCTAHYRRAYGVHEKSLPIEIGPSPQSDRDAWSPKHRDQFCEKWTMRTDGQAIGVASSYSLSARYPESTCNCNVGECKFPEFWSDGRKIMVHMSSAFEDGVFVEQEFHSDYENPGNSRELFLTSRTSYSANGKILASHYAGQGVESYVVADDDIRLDEGHFSPLIRD